MQKDGNCIREAFKLKRTLWGDVYYVARLPSGVILGQSYLVLTGSPPEDLARNSADNGYFDVPQLTVEEVLKAGHHLRKPSDADKLVFT